MKYFIHGTFLLLVNLANCEFNLLTKHDLQDKEIFSDDADEILSLLETTVIITRHLKIKARKVCIVVIVSNELLKRRYSFGGS